MMGFKNNLDIEATNELEKKNLQSCPLTSLKYNPQLSMRLKSDPMLFICPTKDSLVKHSDHISSATANKFI